MEGDELRDLARRAANYTGYRTILVLGSQAVHGSLPDVPLPPLTTASEEADLAVPSPAADDDVAHAIEAQFGMGSPYHSTSACTPMGSHCRRSRCRTAGKGACAANRSMTTTPTTR